METQYKIVTELVTKERMYLNTKDTKNLLLEIGDKQLFGKDVPRIGDNSLNYNNDKGFWSFGCSIGKFTYEELLKTIKEAEEALVVKKINGLKAKGKPNVEAEVEEESEHYYIVGGKAYAKSEYSKALVIVKEVKPNFGDFKWKKYGNDYYENEYQYKGHSVGSSIKLILNSLLQAKAIIDFFKSKTQENETISNSN